MLVFLYVIVSFIVTGVLVGLLHGGTAGNLSELNIAFIAGVAFLLAAAWTWLTKDDYYKDREGNRKKMDTVHSFAFISMKIWAYIFVIAGLVFLGFSTQQTSNKSRVSNFYYGGYGDTVYAMLHGNVFRLDTSIKTKDSLIALPDVTISIEENGKTILTDSSGHFELWFVKGTFNLRVSKEGYQPLQVKHYVSDPDQFSGITIYLEKGKEEQEFELPEWKQ